MLLVVSGYQLQEYWRQGQGINLWMAASWLQLKIMFHLMLSRVRRHA
jgi:hypothetical protein